MFMRVLLGLLAVVVASTAQVPPFGTELGRWNLQMSGAYAGPADSPVAPMMATDNNPNAVARSVRSLTSMDDPPTMEWQFDCEFESVYNVGVTPVQDSLCWVSAGQVTLKIGIYNIADPTHPFRMSFAQTGGPSGWGIRDMAYKASTDEVFAGFDGQRFHVYNATTHVPNNTYTISGYTGTVRGMGYDPAQDSCWTCNFTTSPMAKFSITGTNGHQVRAAANMASAYGISWDAVQNCFWVSHAGAAGTSPIWKMDPTYAVVDSFNLAGWDLAGGCENWRDTFLLALEQATPDMIWCFRFNMGPGLAHDVGVTEIRQPPASMNQGTVTPKCVIRNFGSNAESNIPVTCWIDSAGTRVYNQSATFTGPLAPGAVDSIAMPAPWNTGPAGNQYAVTFFTGLAVDENRANDTVDQTTTISGAIVSDSITVNRIEIFAPVIDGAIGQAEWAASNCYDVSDVLGRSGTPRPLGSCFMYFMYDDSFAYLAMDLPPVTTRGDYDQFGPYFDEDRSGTWSTDSSEGNHWVEYVSADSVVYRALLSTAPAVWRMPGQCPGCVSRGGLTSGHLQMEAKIPFGTRKGDWTVAPGDTTGYFEYSASAPGTNYWGWWPQSLVMGNWANPAYYGFMWFDPQVGIEEGKAASVPYALYRVANPVRNSAQISYYVAQRSGVTLGVYDVAGKLVKSLANGTFEPGVRTTTWNRTADNGSRVASGTYFYRLTVNDKSVSAKAVVVE